MYLENILNCRLNKTMQGLEKEISPLSPSSTLFRGKSCVVGALWSELFLFNNFSYAPCWGHCFTIGCETAGMKWLGRFMVVSKPNTFSEYFCGSPVEVCNIVPVTWITLAWRSSLRPGLQVLKVDQSFVLGQVHTVQESFTQRQTVLVHY